MRYVILAKGQHKGFNIPRQLSVINSERLLDRTIRLLRENGVKDIIVTGSYTDIDAKVIDPKGNTYDYNNDSKGYWLDAFDGLLEEPTTFLMGDVYFSEVAIKTIVNTDKEMFFCSDKNTSKDYIKEWDEPFGYKVINTDRFKEAIKKAKDLYDNGKTKRNPIIWEVYRLLNGININKHKLTYNYIAINDITCDIDKPEDVAKINFKLGVGKMIRVKAKINFSYSKFSEVKELVRANAEGNQEGTIQPGDMFIVSNEQAEYLTEKADWCKANGPLVDIIEVIPEEKKETKEEKKEVKKATKKATKKTTKK